MSSSIPGYYPLGSNNYTIALSRMITTFSKGERNQIYWMIIQRILRIMKHENRLMNKASLRVELSLILISDH